MILVSWWRFRILGAILDLSDVGIGKYPDIFKLVWVVVPSSKIIMAGIIIIYLAFYGIGYEKKNQSNSKTDFYSYNNIVPFNAIVR